MKKHFLFVVVFAMMAAFSCKESSSLDDMDISLVTPPAKVTLETAERPVVLTEQAADRIVIQDVSTRKLLWEWSPSMSGMSASDAKLFHLPDECKPVYNRTCLLITASGGGVALVRIKDKKVLFYANAGGNPHSAEVLPDGNIVVACSDGACIKLYKYSPNYPFAAAPMFSVPVTSAHNVVWDEKRSCLWTATVNKIERYQYDATRLELSKQAEYANALGYSWAHDLVPVYGEDKLYVCFTGGVAQFDIATTSFVKVGLFNTVNVKSVSSAPSPMGLCMSIGLSATEWWSPTVYSAAGEELFREESYKIYKSRWYIDNPFSYGEKGQQLK